jgi:uncharacterized repeat protein (TIGR01451 family)/CSLREA domain-containing protein
MQFQFAESTLVDRLCPSYARRNPMPHRRPRIKIRRRNLSAWLETLEDRMLLATITVNTTADDVTSDATLSLREAIEVANGTLAVSSLSAQEQAQVSGALSNPNTIAFNIPGAGVHMIAPATDLPSITSPMIIDGYTQPGSSPNSNPVTTGINAIPLIELSSAVANSGTGLSISAGASTIRGLVINGFHTGIELRTNGSNTIAGNFIGTDPSGKIAAPNSEFGISIPDSGNNTIGGPGRGDRNLISGNKAAGIGSLGFVSGLLMQGNFIGTDITGTKALGNENGMYFLPTPGGSGVSIGGTAAGARNVISGNIQSGIQLNNYSGTLIQGNFVGTDVTGTAVLGNGTGGVDLRVGEGCTVGGTAAGTGNVICANGGGINLAVSNSLVQGNFIGTDLTGTLDLGNFTIGIQLATTSTHNTIGGTAAGSANTIAFTEVSGNPNFGPYGIVNVPGNTILGNSIFGNLGFGILPGGAIPTPVLTGASGTSIAGTLSGPTDTNFRLEFFATPNTGKYSDHQGKTFLGATDVTTDGTGMASYTFSRLGGIPAGQFLTATATSATGTSGFSTAISIAAASSADLSLQGTASSTVAQGSNVTYALTVANGGNAAATGVMLIDTLPANASFVSATGGVTPVNGVLTFNLGNLASGTQAPTITIVVAANAAGALTNSATVSGNEADATPADNSITQPTTVQAAAAVADLSLVGSAPAAVTLGNSVTYRYTVTNAGPSNATGVRLVDILPAGAKFVSATGGATAINGVLTLSVGNLAANVSEAFTIVLTPTMTGTLTNPVRVSGNEIDPALGNNAVSVRTQVLAAPSAGDGPTVASVIRFGFHRRPTVLVLTFIDALDPSRATDPAAYLIDDARGHRVGISRIVYDPNSNAVAITPDRLLNFHRPFKLRVLGTGVHALRDTEGRALDGSRTGLAGSDYTVAITRRNLVAPDGPPDWALGSQPTALPQSRVVRNRLRR